MNYRRPTYLLAVLAASWSMTAQPDAWRVRMDEGNALRDGGAYGEAAVRFREAARLAEDAKTPLRFASALNSLALAYDDLGRYADAEREIGRSLTIVENAVGRRSAARAQVLVNASGIYQHLEQRAKSEAVLREAIDIYSGLVPPDSEMLALARSSLAEALLRKQAYKEAEPLIEQALAVFERNQASRNGNFGMALTNLGAVRLYQKRIDEAANIFERSLAILEDEKGPEHPVLIFALDGLGVVYTKAGRKDDAEVAFRRALQIMEKHLGTAHPLYGSVLMNYAGLLRLTGRKSEAKRVEGQAKALMRDGAQTSGAGFTIDVSTFRGK